MNCPTCHKDNSPANDYCYACGTDFPKRPERRAEEDSRAAPGYVATCEQPCLGGLCGRPATYRGRISGDTLCTGHAETRRHCATEQVTEITPPRPTLEAQLRLALMGLERTDRKDNPASHSFWLREVKRIQKALKVKARRRPFGASEKLTDPTKLNRGN